MSKKHIILLLAILTTIIEYYWFLPVGTSYTVLSDSILQLVFMVVLLTIIVLLIAFFFPKKGCFKTSVFLVVFWLFFNYQSFADRVSRWSTYLFHEELSEVFYLSIIPIGTCISIFIVGYLYLGKLTVHNDIEKNN